MSGDAFEQIEIPDLTELDINGVTPIEINPQHHQSFSSADSEHINTNKLDSDLVSKAPIPREEEERKPTAEYALHILFTRFVRYTEKKLAKYEGLSGNEIEQIFGEGAEPECDMILESLGHVAQRMPKPVIDSIMYWLHTKRDKPNGKSDAALYVSCRALMEVITQAPHGVLGEKLCMMLEENIFKQILYGKLVPEGSGVKPISDVNWRYLARLLGEMSSFRLASVDDRFIAELEKPENSRSHEARAIVLLKALRYLKIKLYPEEFLEESSAFLESLSKFYTNTPFTSVLREKYASAISQILEPLAETITVEVNQPMWASTMQTLFKASLERPPATGLASRTASSAGIAVANSSSLPAFSLSVMSLCLSPQPVFSEHWFKLLESNVSKNKPLRNISLFPAAARLTWVYMFRCGESLNLTTKKIEAIRKMFFANTTRKYWQAIDSDKEARAAAVSLVRSCFQGYQQYTLDEVLFRLLVGADANSAQNHGTAFDSVLPERASIAVDAFVEIVQDLNSGIRPPFPSENSNTPQVAVQDGLAGAKESTLAKSELPHRPVVPPALMASIDLFGTCIGEISGWLEQGGVTAEHSSRQNSVSHLMVSFTSGGSNSNSNQSAEIQRSNLGLRSPDEYLLLLFLKSWPSWWKPEQHIRFLDVLSRCVSYPVQVLREAAAESIRLIAHTADLKQILTPFSKAMMIADAKNAESSDILGTSPSSAGATRSSDSGSSGSGGFSHGHSFSFGNGNTFNLGLGLHTASNSSDLDSNSINGSNTIPSSTALRGRSGSETQANLLLHPQHKMLCHLLLYVELIEEWINRLQNGDAAIKASSVEAQLLGLWAAVEEIEGNGLYFVCSQDMEVRSHGLRILWLTTNMDEAILNYRETQNTSAKKESRPLRVINLLQNTPITQIASSENKRFELNGPEQQRLKMFGSKRASLARLAESRFGVDTAMWRKLFPSVICLCFENHPIPMALCRNLVVDRLGQMYDVVNDIANRSGNYPFDVSTVAIIEQWKIYLIVACSTLTITEEQKLYVPTLSSSNNSSYTGSMHSKKPSQKLTLHHKRITSIKSVFRIVAPMLKSENNTVREAMVTGLSCTNVNTFKALLECLQPVLSSDIQKLQQHQPNQSKNSNVNCDALLRSVTCITQVFTHTTSLLKTKEIRQDIWIRTEIVSVLHQLRELLSPMQSMDVASLRVSFCELLADTYNTLKPSLMFYGRNSAREWMLFRSIVEHWSPFGTNANAVLESRSIMKRRAQNDVVLAQLEVMNRDLDRATSLAMAALFVDSHEFISDLAPYLHWIYTSLATNSQSSAQEISRVALENLILSHASRSELLWDVVGHCYHNTSERSRGVAKVYFVALVNVLESHPDLILTKVEKPQQLLALALFKIGDPDFETRFRAVKLIEIVENGLYGSSVLSGEYQFKLRSTSPSVYKREIFVLSGKLANKRSHESFYLFSQMTRAFQAVNDGDRRDILSVLLPWIQNLEFNKDSELGLQMVIANLLEITAVFSGRMQHEVEALWIALCTSPSGISSNALKILDFLLSFCLQFRSPGAVAVSRTVLIYLLASPASGAITEKLLEYLEPKYMITHNGQSFTELVSPESKNEYPYVASLTDIVSLANEKEARGKNKMLPSFSYCQLAVVFLVDTISTSTPIVAKIASLIHVCVVLGDHFVGLVQEKTRELLLNLAGMLNPEPEAMQRFTDSVTSLRWRYEDDSGTVPDQLSELIFAILSHLGTREILDFREWAQNAILWATTSPVRHIACRSLQIYRCLELHLDVRMLGDILVRLSGTISEQAVDIQGFSSQILMTINSIIDKLEPVELVSYPSLFWASIASLSTSNEREYIEGLSAVNKLLDKWSDDFAWSAVSSYPSKWECDIADFPGALKLVLVGYRSQNTAELSHTVSNKLILLSETATENDALLFFGSRSPLPQLLTASVPWMLNAMDQPHLISRLVLPTQALQRMITPYSNGLSRILESFEKRRLWSKSDFLRQFFLAFNDAFPDDVSSAMILVMSMVNNGSASIRKAALEILRIIVPEVKSKDPIHVKRCGAELIAPLLRLLTTPDVEEALQVLDIFGYVRPDRKDKDVLRMTLGSRQLLHEYENTETLFGIPDEAGWSVPMPTQASMITKANMHAAFYSCISTDISYSADKLFEPVSSDGNNQQFQLEEYAPANGTLFTQNSATFAHNVNTASSIQPGFESMDKILTDLDEYDSFFTRVAAPHQTSVTTESPSRASRLHNNGENRPNSPNDQLSHIPSDQTNTPIEPQLSTRSRSVSETESIPQLYDKKVSVIINQSLARTPSQVSFRSSFGENLGRNLSSQSGPIAVTNHHTHSSSYAHLRHGSRTAHASTSGFDSAGGISLGRRQMSADSTATISDATEADIYHTASKPSVSSNYHSDIGRQASLDFGPKSHSSIGTPPSSSSFHQSFTKKSTDKLESFDFFYSDSPEPPKPTSKASQRDTDKPLPPVPSPSKKTTSKSQAESSFRLESLLRVKRKAKAAKKAVEKQQSSSSISNGDTFQFPPR